MDIQELEKIMVEYGVVLRPIPKIVRSVYEKKYATTTPDGVVKYMEKYKREMLVVERVPENAGKFIFECQKNTNRIVHFHGKKYFDSIEEAIQYLLSNN